jgi:hypothetical protein
MARNMPSRVAPQRCSTLALFENVRLGWKGFANDKHCIFFTSLSIMKKKRPTILIAGVQCYKMFIFVAMLVERN